MSERTVRLRFVAGATTCFVAPNEPCQYVGTRRLGTQWVCRLFPAPDLAYTALADSDGWLQRCADCLAAEVREEEP